MSSKQPPQENVLISKNEHEDAPNQSEKPTNDETQYLDPRPIPPLNKKPPVFWTAWLSKHKITILAV